MVRRVIKNKELSRMKPRKWSIEWRGTITRDIGWDEETADTCAQATQQYQARYPMRKIVAVNQIKETE
jgi:hypothetical protein